MLAQPSRKPSTSKKEKGNAHFEQHQDHHEPKRPIFGKHTFKKYGLRKTATAEKTTLKDPAPPVNENQTQTKGQTRDAAHQRYHPEHSSQSSLGSFREENAGATEARRANAAQQIRGPPIPVQRPVRLERYDGFSGRSTAASKRLGVRVEIPTESSAAGETYESLGYPASFAVSQTPPALTSSHDSPVSSNTSARQQFLSEFAHPTSLESLRSGNQRFNYATRPDPETFYASSSEDEENAIEESQYSSQYSTRSSATSYGVTSPQIDENIVRFDGEDDRNWLSDHRIKRQTHSTELEFHPQFPAISEVSSERTSSPEDNSQVKPGTSAAVKRPGKSDNAARTHSRNFSRPSVSLPKTVLKKSTNDPQPPHSGAKKVENAAVTAPFPSVLSTADRISARPLSLAVMKESEAMISADAAEGIIIHVFESVNAFKDLFCLARINRGFYNVFKQHELELMKNTLRNMSPAAWELRESSPREIIAALETPKSEYTPTRYFQFHTRDTYILAGLKSAILSRCQSQIRPETAEALRNRDATRFGSVDDALWRIWTFCNLFGCGKDREDDKESQIDWLRGGLEAHECIRKSTTDSRHTGTASRTAASGATDQLAYFGRGNLDGLNADELLAMIEMWDCIKAMLLSIAGPARVSQARSYGVFDGLEVLEGDLQREQALLAEWVHYLSTLGLSTVVDLAADMTAQPDVVFITAQDMGWTSWAPPSPGHSRENFLKEVVSELYEEKISQGNRVITDANDTDVKFRRRSKRISLMEEIKEKKKSLDFSELASTSGERPLSMWVHWINKLEIPDPTVPSTIEEAPSRGISEEATQSVSRRERPPATARQPPRPRTSSVTLSIFPPQYSRNNTPNASTKASPVATPVISPAATPMRSRASSLRSGEAGPKSQSPRNSRRPSVLRLPSNNTLAETLQEEPQESEEDQGHLSRRPATSGAIGNTAEPTMSRNESFELLSSATYAPTTARPSTSAASHPPSAPPTVPLPPTPTQRNKPRR